MAFLEWRRLNFFELHKEVDSGRVAEALQDTSVKVASSGNSHVILCDATGCVHIVSRSWSVTSFKAYEICVTLAQQFAHEPYLVTIGEDEPGTNPLIKVWDWSRTDRHGNPICVRVSRAVPSHLRPTPATALAIHENKNLLAVGYSDGCVSLFKGDVTRQRSSKMRTLTESGTSPVTALAFKGTEQLFVVSRAAVMVYYLLADRCITLDPSGAAPHCSVLADKENLMVAKADAIYCYTTEGRGPCYVLPGEKKRLDWFRNYLVITTVESKNQSSRTNEITIIDIQNRFKVFAMTFDEINAVLTGWGSLYILTKANELMYLDEIDLQSKLAILFKKNLFEVAIRIASSQHYDAEGLMEIYKQYGDHLYDKRDFRGAIEQYVKTIGRLETSYVIRKYLESRHLEPLVYYLQELHRKGCATEDHTTLLLTCFVKLDQHDQQGKLKEFINSKDKVIEFDVDVAIKVVRQVSPEDAFALARNHKRHDWCLKILMEDKKEPMRALEYIGDLEFHDAHHYMKKYGNALIQSCPHESTEFLKRLCTDYRPRSKPLVDEATLSGAEAPAPERAAPDDFIHLFLSSSERLIELLEHMTAAHAHCSELVYNALVEHYIHVWAKVPAPSEKLEYEQKIMKLLKSAEGSYDKDQLLIICQMLGFRQGILYLYEEKKLWRAQVSLQARAGEWAGALATCRRRGAACPALWLDVLRAQPPACHLPEVLAVIASERLLSPLLVIDSLSSAASCTLGDIRKYLTDVLKTETEVTSREHELAEKYRAETARMKARIDSIQREPATFQASRCTACNQALELPSVHFLCRHSFHQHCFQSFSEGEGECPGCAGSRAGPPPAQPRTAETLHGRLRTEPDPYAVVSEYFGRGLFNKVTVLTEGAGVPAAASEPRAAPPAPAAAAAPAPAPVVSQPTYGPGAEARMRLEEGQSKQVYVSDTVRQVASKGTAIIPISEGRMRVLEQQRREEHKYSSSLEANMSQLHSQDSLNRSEHLEPSRTAKNFTEGKRLDRLKDGGSAPASAGTSPKISTAIVNTQNPTASTNPFEDDAAEGYDETMNPFAEEDDDYDKNLNPFA